MDIMGFGSHVTKISRPTGSGDWIRWRQPHESLSVSGIHVIAETAAQSAVFRRASGKASYVELRDVRVDQTGPGYVFELDNSGVSSFVEIRDCAWHGDGIIFTASRSLYAYNSRFQIYHGSSGLHDRVALRKTGRGRWWLYNCHIGATRGYWQFVDAASDSWISFGLPNGEYACYGILDTSQVQGNNRGHIYLRNCDGYIRNERSVHSPLTWLKTSSEVVVRIHGGYYQAEGSSSTTKTLWDLDSGTQFEHLNAARLSSTPAGEPGATSNVTWGGRRIASDHRIEAMRLAGLYLCDASQGAVSITLPNPNRAGPGAAFKFVKTDASSNPVVVDLNTATVEGSPFGPVLMQQWSKVTLVYAGDGVWINEAPVS